VYPSALHTKGKCIVQMMLFMVLVTDILLHWTAAGSVLTNGTLLSASNSAWCIDSVQIIWYFISVRQQVLRQDGFLGCDVFSTVDHVTEEPGAIIFRTEENCGNIFHWNVGNGIPNCTAHSPEVGSCLQSKGWFRLLWETITCPLQTANYELCR
jgi:hypothetical protein